MSFASSRNGLTSLKILMSRQRWHFSRLLGQFSLWAVWFQWCHQLLVDHTFSYNKAKDQPLWTSWQVFQGLLHKWLLLQKHQHTQVYPRLWSESDSGTYRDIYFSPVRCNSSRLWKGRKGFLGYNPPDEAIHQRWFPAPGLPKTTTLRESFPEARYLETSCVLSFWSWGVGNASRAAIFDFGRDFEKYRSCAITTILMEMVVCVQSHWKSNCAIRYQLAMSLTADVDGRVMYRLDTRLVTEPPQGI